MPKSRDFDRPRTLRGVARRAEVSPTRVSRVLNDNLQVGPHFPGPDSVGGMPPRLSPGSGDVPSLGERRDLNVIVGARFYSETLERVLRTLRIVLHNVPFESPEPSQGVLAVRKKDT
jgi:hypothetical protein